MNPTHRHQPAYWLVPALCGTLVLTALGACQPPRDLELERRLAETKARATTTVQKSPSTATASPRPKKPRTSKTPPQRGALELRHYTAKDIKEIMAKVPGQGPELQVRLETTLGTIDCRLEETATPQAVANFVALATGQRKWLDPDTGELQSRAFYDGLPFHRIIKNFILQTGNPGTTRNGGPGWTIAREKGRAELFDKGGVLAMVDLGEETHGSMFFITLVPYRSHGGKYTPFGRCENLEVARKIAGLKTLEPAAGEKRNTRPVEAAELTRVVLSRNAATK